MGNSVTFFDLLGLDERSIMDHCIIRPDTLAIGSNNSDRDALGFAYSTVALNDIARVACGCKYTVLSDGYTFSKEIVPLQLFDSNESRIILSSQTIKSEWEEADIADFNKRVSVKNYLKALKHRDSGKDGESA